MTPSLNPAEPEEHVSTGKVFCDRAARGNCVGGQSKPIPPRAVALKISVVVHTLPADTGGFL